MFGQELIGEELIQGQIRAFQAILERGSIAVSEFEIGHRQMESSLHPLAASEEIDVSAFIYSSGRLPECMDRTRLVVMGKDVEAFVDSGFPDVVRWKPVRSKARRRLAVFDCKETVAAFICSRSDLDDLIPALTCFQIEWNKMHKRLRSRGLEGVVGLDEKEFRRALDLKREDWELLHRIFPEENWRGIQDAIALGPKDIRIDLASPDLDSIGSVMSRWWSSLVDHFQEVLVQSRPVYFVSSNDHSIANVLSGFAEDHKEAILAHALDSRGELSRRWEDLPDREEWQRNFLYWASRGYLRYHEEARRACRALEEGAGIFRYQRPRFVDLRAQIIEIGKLRPERMDFRLSSEDLRGLKQSRALILNVDYPLGMSARFLLKELLSSLRRLCGVYIMGKAATMLGRIGDLMIPETVYDIHTGEIFRFDNCFSMKDAHRFLLTAGVFDRQKAVTVWGTFLHNRRIMEQFRREDYNSIEMEAGPYLSAIFEGAPGGCLDPAKGPEVGMLHYASDAPYSRRASLLSSSLGFAGTEPTYACTLAILRRIFQKEIERMGNGD